MKTRPVVVSEYVQPEGSPYNAPYELEEKFEGKFHQFGVNYEEFESGAGNFSTAIVEDSSGKIHNVQVELIRFLDVEVSE